MEVLQNDQLSNLSFEYEVNGKLIKRNAIDEKIDEVGTQWILIKTSGDSHSDNEQWVELSFFKMWLVQMSIAA